MIITEREWGDCQERGTDGVSSRVVASPGLSSLLTVFKLFYHSKS